MQCSIHSNREIPGAAGSPGVSVQTDTAENEPLPFHPAAKTLNRDYFRKQQERS
jgi:hypothetical protein